MHYSERRETMLPCGQSLAQSWAALRNSWLGFKISKGNNDRQGMMYYAPFIRKVQREMGIPLTNFDSDLFSDQDENEYTKVESKRGSNNSAERDPDYDSMNEASLSIVNEREANVSPRNVIFRTQNRKNYCKHISDDQKRRAKVNIQRWTTHGTRAEPYLTAKKSAIYGYKR